MRERMLLAYDAQESTRGGNCRAFRGFPGHGQETVATTPPHRRHWRTAPLFRCASPKFWNGTGAKLNRLLATGPYPGRAADRCGIVLLPSGHSLRPGGTEPDPQKDAPRQRAGSGGPEARPGRLAAGMAKAGGRFPGVSGRVGVSKTNMIRLWGRAQRGTRVHDSAPAGHWGTTTLIGSLRAAGPPPA